MSQPSELTLTAVCYNLPTHHFAFEQLRLGVQKGRVGEQWQLLNDLAECQFTLHFRLKPRVNNDKLPNFLGPYAQGKPADRFFYLNWEGLRKGEWHSFRRAKIKLQPVSWARIKAESPIKVTIDCTDKAGGPICATVPSDHLKWD